MPKRSIACMEQPAENERYNKRMADSLHDGCKIQNWSRQTNYPLIIA